MFDAPPLLTVHVWSGRTLTEQGKYSGNLVFEIEWTPALFAVRGPQILSLEAGPGPVTIERSRGW